MRSGPHPGLTSSTGQRSGEEPLRLPEASQCCERGPGAGTGSWDRLTEQSISLSCAVLPRLLAQPPSGGCFTTEIPGGFVSSPFPGVGDTEVQGTTKPAASGWCSTHR